jgi:hypothetical protein
MNIRRIAAGCIGLVCVLSFILVSNKIVTRINKQKELQTFEIGGKPRVATKPAESHKPQEAYAINLEGITPHPRLLINSELITQRKLEIPQSPLLSKLASEMIFLADDALKKPIFGHFYKNSSSLLLAGAATTNRLIILANAYYLTGDIKYALRAERELVALASLKSWKPNHFLDTATIMIALSIGYDWFHKELGESAKQYIRDSLYNKGLLEGLKAYEATTTENKLFFVDKASWPEWTHNWAFVCNGAMIISALALAEDYPDQATTSINYALPRIKSALEKLGPDGVWYEGPDYWRLSLSHLMATVFSLQTALKSDYGLTQFSGLEHTGMSYISLLSPSSLTFNFADAATQTDGSPYLEPGLLWLGNHFNQPLLGVYYAKAINSIIDNAPKIRLGILREVFAPLSLWKLNPNLVNQEYVEPRSKLFQGLVPIARFKASATDSNSMFFAIKGGKNNLTHQQLDLGSFVLEHGGVRWASDIGLEKYNLPGFWDYSKGGQRWKYTRNNNVSHSTISFSNTFQNPEAEAKFIEFEDLGTEMRSVLDLSTAYNEVAGLAHRVTRASDSWVLVDDYVRSIKFNTTLRWNFITDATVRVNKNVAVLRKGNKLFSLEVREQPSTIRFATRSISPASRRETSNSRFRAVALSIPVTPSKDVKVSVLMRPQASQQNLYRYLVRSQRKSFNKRTVSSSPARARARLRRFVFNNFS